MERETLTDDPVVRDMAAGLPTWWWQEPVENVSEAIEASGVDPRIVDEARRRFIRFAPWFRAHYPDSLPTGGILESPLQHEAGFADAYARETGEQLAGSLWFKRDDSLPVSGSVKARGGIHEVLEIAERRAVKAGVLSTDDTYLKFDDPEVRDVLRGFGVSVGSTGNLGLSIGLVAAELGFRTTVHMSSDARGWKKELLRSRGATVVEHEGDFSQAVDAGRAEAEADPSVHFVDDEGSLSLFAGYAVAAGRLAGQLRSLEVKVDLAHPLFVYLPCGVGGAPGGITYGLKRAFGEAVHCVFVEPAASPAMTLGVRTGLHDRVSAHDLGLSGKTSADGLAVARPSKLVGEAVGPLIDAFATLPEEHFLDLLSVLQESEGFAVEPSATAGLAAPWLVERDEAFLASRTLTRDDLARATHLVWFTGGSMVPEEEMAGYLAGRSQHP